MSSNDFLSKTTLAPPAPPPVTPPSSVEPWIGVIIFALVFGLSLVAAGFFYRHRTRQNEKFVQGLRNQLRETMEREDKPYYPDPPYTLRIDESRMPPTKLPEGSGFGGRHSSPGKLGSKNVSESRKRSKKGKR